MKHYTTIKSLSRLLRSSNMKNRRKQHFCMNCLQGFTQEASRDQHQVYCENNEFVRIEMPKQGLKDQFKDGQIDQFKVPFIMYADFESILGPAQSEVGSKSQSSRYESGDLNPNLPYTHEVN